MVLEPWLARSPGGRLLCVAAAVQGGTSATRDSWLPPAPKDVPVDMCMGVNGSINVKSDEQGGWIRAQSGIWMTPITLWENLVPHRLSFDLQTQSCTLALHYPPPRNGAVILFRAAAGSMCFRGAVQNGRRPLNLLGQKLQTLARLTSNTKF